MNAHDRLFNWRTAFDHTVPLWITAAAGAMLLLCPLILLAIQSRLRAETNTELWARWKSWLVLALLMAGPVLLGAAWVFGATLLLSLACCREYVRATGLFRERLIWWVLTLCIIVTFFAVIDHWYGFFMALAPLSIGVIAVAGIVRDHPDGYIQRVALGVFGYMLFGSALGHFAYFANDAAFRQILLLLILSVEMNDVFGYLVGKPFGHRRLIPKTSPGKTVAGAFGSVILTSALVVWVGEYVFAGTVMAGLSHRIGLGLIISVVGILGDLMLSSIKRDLGIKDMGTTFPGHGGLLDRFDSLILVAPAAFHFIGYFNGIGLDQPVRILSGGAG